MVLLWQILLIMQLKVIEFNCTIVYLIAICLTATSYKMTETVVFVCIFYMYGHIHSTGVTVTLFKKAGHFEKPFVQFPYTFEFTANTYIVVIPTTFSPVSFSRI